MKSKLALAGAILALLVSGCTKNADPVAVVAAPVSSAESIQRAHDARLEVMTPWQLIDEAHPYAIKSMKGDAQASLEFTFISQVFERKLKNIQDQDEMLKLGGAWVTMTSAAMSGK